MASIASRDGFVRALSNCQQESCPHVWLHSDGRLVTGAYPKPVAYFDFAAEVLNEFDFEQVSDDAAAIRKKYVSLLGSAKRVTQRYEIETVDTIYEVGSATQALLRGLEIIERIRPGTLDRLSQEKARSKRPVSRERSALYDLPRQVEHSEQIESGHWVATNNKTPEALGVLKKAMRLAELERDQFWFREVKTS